MINIHQHIIPRLHLNPISNGGDDFDFDLDESVSDVLVSVLDVLILLSSSSPLLFLDDDGPLSFIAESD